MFIFIFVIVNYFLSLFFFIFILFSLLFLSCIFFFNFSNIVFLPDQLNYCSLKLSWGWGWRRRKWSKIFISYKIWSLTFFCYSNISTSIIKIIFVVVSDTYSYQDNKREKLITTLMTFFLFKWLDKFSNRTQLKCLIWRWIMHPYHISKKIEKWDSFCEQKRCEMFIE